jgi:hypothetical protein
MMTCLLGSQRGKITAGYQTNVCGPHVCIPIHLAASKETAECAFLLEVCQGSCLRSPLRNHGRHDAHSGGHDRQRGAAR